MTKTNIETLKVKCFLFDYIMQCNKNDDVTLSFDCPF